MYAKIISITGNFFSGWRTFLRILKGAAAIELYNIDGGKVTKNVMQQKKTSNDSTVINNNCNPLIIGDNIFK